MIRLVHRSLTERSSKGKGDFIFVDFNAWLYQGYDDARAALMQVIGEKLTEEAERRKKGLDKAKEFVERIRWFRLAKLVAGSAAALYAGVPPVGLVGELYGLGKAFYGGEVTAEAIGKTQKVAGEVEDTASGLPDAKKKSSPPQEIHALRESFEKTLEAMDVTLVVLIDDLDRCLPPQKPHLQPISPNEIGLDGGPEYQRYWNDQAMVFDHVLTGCRDAGGRVMSIHSRRASKAVIDRLEGCPEAGTPVLHWFSGSLRDLDRAVDLGSWFSVGPAMLRTEKGRALAARMPRERMLTESDGPFA